MDLEHVTWITVHGLGLISMSHSNDHFATCPDLLGEFEHVLGLIRPDNLLCHQQITSPLI